MNLLPFKTLGVRFRMPDVVKELSKSQLKTYKGLIKVYKPDQAFYHMVFPKARTTCTNPECDNETSYIRAGDYWKYRPYCSTKCEASDPKRKALRKATNVKLWGGHPMQNASFQKKRDQKYFEKHGVKNPGQNPKVQAKMKRTNLERYGSENAFSSPVLKDKIIAAYKKNLGVSNPMKSAKVKAALEKNNLKKYGVKNAGHSKQARANRIATNLERFGGHHMQNPEFFAKHQASSFSSKTLTVNGVEFFLRGYEGHVIQVLVNNLGVPVNRIKTMPSDQHEIWWKDSKGKKHRYYPDIRVRHKGKDISIEVMSIYTVGLKSAQLFRQVKAKAKAAYKAGVDLRVWVTLPDQKRIIRISNFEALTMKQLKERVI